MSKFLNRKSSLRLLSCIMAFCMLMTMFANTIGIYASAVDTEAITVWDGKTDNYSSLDAVLVDLGAADADGYYHIKTANQLYGVIKFGGGGNSYKLDNNLYLNEGWEDSANWAYGSKTLNDWTFADGTLGNPTYKFHGTLDGCGYTVYGMYSDVDKAYNGLIGAVDNDTVVKNLNVWHSYIRSAGSAGVIIGGNRYDFLGSVPNMAITIDGCSVRYATIDNVWNNGPSGALIGMTSRKVTVNNCSVADVKFKSGSSNPADHNRFGCMGSFVGALYANTNIDTATYNAGQGKQLIINNSYAVNVVNASNNNAPVYVCGLYAESATKWTFSITANNVYTDATAVTTNTAGTVKLLVSKDSTNVIDPTSADYPIKAITADGIKGSLAKTAMPNLSWKAWTVVENDYPVYKELEIWDGKTDNYASLDAVLIDLGSADSEGYYHIKTAEQLYGVIKYNGGGNKYKLDNDLYLNSDYENSANWTFSNAPANEWAFNSNSWTNPQYKFYGTIDGCGHTVYGLYSNNDLGYNGLIGTVYDTTVIKNLNVWNSYVRGVRSTGIIVGGNFYNSPQTATITLDGCSVRYATIDNVWNNSPSGGIIGMTTRPTTINNCAVADVKFTSGSSNASDNNRFGCMGSFVGAIYASTSDACDIYNVGQAKVVNISNSYAVNVVNASNNNRPVYVCGLYAESATKWTFSITANNVYTDATAVTTNTAGTVKLLVSTDGTTAIDPANVNYPIKTITADGIKGGLAKTAMSDLNWKAWTVVENDYPIYREFKINIWDGKTDNYTSLDGVLADLGVADSDGYYHIKTANQLYGVIKFGGGGNSYKLDNDLYLNADWENSANWAYGNKTLNDWTFAGGTLGNPDYSFFGTIDGCNHTVYGMYSDVDDEYNGLIGAVSDTTVVKNLNVWHSYIRSANSAGIIIGGNHWQCSESETMTITIDGCSVRYATIDNVWNNGPSGALIGMTSRKVTVSNCSVVDVKFKSGAASTAHNAYGCMGSFVGALYRNTSADISVYNAGQGKQININDSYAVNVVNASNNNAPVYICGIYCESTSSNKWAFSITANNVYTDATAVSQSTDGSVKLLVSKDGVNAIAPTDANYPIKNPNDDNFAGLFENGTWYMGASEDSLPILKSRTAGFNYLDITAECIDDEYNAIDLQYIKNRLFETEGYEYILADVNYDGNVDILDIIRLKEILLGKN